MSTDQASSFSSLCFVPSDAADAVACVIAVIRARKDDVVKEWRALCASSIDGGSPLDDGVVRQMYVPALRGAAESLARGDVAGFVGGARALGARLREHGLPFAATIAHLSFLKQGCIAVLARESADTAAAVLLLDGLMATLVSAAAESYYVERPAEVAPRHIDDGLASSLRSTGFFHGMVGHSPAMQRVFARVRSLAASDAATLVVGETGTGKELVARAMHRTGPRRDGPFLAVNCAALPRELIESELFGYKRGAFSGAVGECLGLFRAATGGTLLLDEITEMAPELQAKLLRVLQERAVRPVGAVSEEPVDVRIVASTNRDPDKALQAGLIRPDLYYRLSVAKIAVPPLRERPTDIPALVEYHLAVLDARNGRRAQGITEAALEALVFEPWHGNVRQLFNVVENAFTACTGVIDVADLDLPSGRTMDGIPTVEESERTLIERTLAVTGGNKRRAAQLLGISRKTLYARLARYGRTG